MSDIFTGYINRDDRHIPDGIKTPLNSDVKRRTNHLEITILQSCGSEDWKLRKFYETSYCVRLGEEEAVEDLGYISLCQIHREVCNE